MKPIIWIEGIIGAGKTTISKQLARKLNFRPLLEPVASNPYLELYYKEPKRWAFPMQIDLLMRRYSMQKLASYESISDSNFNGVVLDRGLPGDRVFAKLHFLAGNISPLEWQTYERAFTIMTSDLRPPSLLIYLDVDPRIAKARSEERDRKEEDGIPLSYYKKLQKGYLDVLAEIETGKNIWSGIEVFKIGWNSDHLPLEEIIAEIKRRFAIEPVPRKLRSLDSYFNQ